MSWFISVLICLIMEGTYFGSTENSIINNLSIITTLNIAGLIEIPALNLNFFSGIMRILLWDYSFYSGGYAILRYFWMVIFTPGAVWGLAQFLMQVYASFIKAF